MDMYMGWHVPMIEFEQFSGGAVATEERPQQISKKARFQIVMSYIVLEYARLLGTVQVSVMGCMLQKQSVG
jgi:hypothetical protein